VKPFSGRAALVAASFALVACAAPFAALAQGYPAKPIRIIVPFAPGGGTDTSMRALGTVLSENLGQPVIVDNRPGAAANLGAEIAARAEPDGYTLFAIADPHTVNPLLFPKLTYDIVKDFTPITMVAQSPYVLIAHPSLPVANLKELIAYAKQHPNELSYAHAGNGTAAHLTGEMLKLEAGIQMAPIAYKGGGAAVSDVVGGHVKLGILALAAPMPHIKAGALKALAVTSDKRLDVLPNVSTFAESGLPGIQTFQWVGLEAPAGTPAPIVAKLHAEVVKAAQNKNVVERLAASGLAVSTSASPEAFGRFIRDDMAKWPPVVKASGVKLE
jgi:tripartite-type tricarboxylate transporter receptor subunit TctC